MCQFQLPNHNSGSVFFLGRRKRFSVALENYGAIIQGIEHPVYFDWKYRCSASGKKSFRLQI